MPGLLFFAQMNPFQIEPGQVIGYSALTGAFLFLMWFINDPKRPLGTSLIYWGILVSILAIGYGLIGVPTVIMLTAALTKIGFLMVLGGVASSLLASCRNPTTTEADHA